MSVEEIERLFEDLRGVDASYGRTLAEAALDGADPRAMGERYGRAFGHQSIGSWCGIHGSPAH